MIPKINNRALIFTMLLVCISASECNSGLRKGITQSPLKESSPEPPSERSKLVTDPFSPPIEGRKIWRGRSGGIDIWWTTVDLYYQDDSGVKGIWGTLARKDFEDFDASLREDARAGEKMDCDYNREFEVLSVVGSLVSFADYYADFCRGGAHPGADIRFTTIDLKKAGELLYARGKDASGMDVDLKESGKVIKLTDYFPEEEILRTLLDDAVVKRALATLYSPRKPKTLAELPELFAENDYELGDSQYEIAPQPPLITFTRPRWVGRRSRRCKAMEASVIGLCIPAARGLPLIIGREVTPASKPQIR
jgi:hypothetical protein